MAKSFCFRISPVILVPDFWEAVYWTKVHNKTTNQWQVNWMNRSRLGWTGLEKCVNTVVFQHFPRPQCLVTKETFVCRSTSSLRSKRQIKLLWSSLICHSLTPTCQFSTAVSSISFRNYDGFQSFLQRIWQVACPRQVSTWIIYSVSR